MGRSKSAKYIVTPSILGSLKANGKRMNEKVTSLKLRIFERVMSDEEIRGQSHA